MDGINPTLAFAALLFGLSGNAHHAAQDTATNIGIENGAGCPALIVAVEPPASAVAPARQAEGSDPIVRHNVPVANARPADPCNPDR